MASSTEISNKALEDIKALLGNLNDDHVWDLINEIRNTCNVIIPVWFTPTLVKEITEDDLGVCISEDQTINVIEKVNDNDIAYSLGRNLVVNLIENSFEEEEEDEEETK